MNQAAVESHARFRAVLCLTRPDGLAAALVDEGYEVTAIEASEDVFDLAAEGTVSVVVFDDQSDNWLRMVSDLRRAQPEVAVVLVGSIERGDEFLAAVAAGVDGFCSPAASVDGMMRTIRSVETSGVAIPRSMVLPLVEHVRHGRGRTVHTAAGPIDVTDREWDVLTSLLQRRSTREIAEELFVSVGTVRSHVSTLLRKIGAVDREDAIRLIERGRTD